MCEYEGGWLEEKDQWSLDINPIIMFPFLFHFTHCDLQDIGIDPATDVRILMLIWNMGAERPGEVSKEVGNNCFINDL